MAQADFAYLAASNDPAGMPMALSVFADRAQLRGGRGGRLRTEIF